MFCYKCGKQIEDDAKFCSSCGAVINGDKTQQENRVKEGNNNSPIHHEKPKCTYCGNVEDWQVGPLFRTMDYVIGIGLCVMGILPGIAYLGVVGLIRSNKDNREKICKKCGAKNMFTNMY